MNVPTNSTNICQLSTLFYFSIISFLHSLFVLTSVCFLLCLISLTVLPFSASSCLSRIGLQFRQDFGGGESYRICLHQKQVCRKFRHPSSACNMRRICCHRLSVLQLWSLVCYEYFAFCAVPEDRSRCRHAICLLRGLRIT